MRPVLVRALCASVLLPGIVFAPAALAAGVAMGPGSRPAPDFVPPGTDPGPTYVRFPAPPKQVAAMNA